MSEEDNSIKPNIIYPAYINANRTIARGRRIPLQHAVEDPKPNEIVDALFALKGFQAQARPKPYTRELDKEAMPWRIEYSNVNPSKNNLANKRQVLVACSKRISEIRAKSSSSNQQSEAPSDKSKKKKKK